MLTKNEIIHNENALKSAIYFKGRSEEIQNILLDCMTYMHSDSLLFLSKISCFIKDKNISSWIRGDVGESLLKLNLKEDKEISKILKEILLDNTINTKRRYDIAKCIFKFYEDENFIHEIGEIINNKKMSSWVRGGLIYALIDIGNRDYIDRILEFITDTNENKLVKLEIKKKVKKFLLK